VTERALNKGDKSGHFTLHFSFPILNYITSFPLKVNGGQHLMPDLFSFIPFHPFTLFQPTPMTPIQAQEQGAFPQGCQLFYAGTLFSNHTWSALEKQADKEPPKKAGCFIRIPIHIIIRAGMEATGHLLDSPEGKPLAPEKKVIETKMG
jgi:hypothetical protein